MMHVTSSVMNKPLSRRFLSSRLDLATYDALIAPFGTKMTRIPQPMPATDGHGHYKAGFETLLNRNDGSSYDV